MKFLPFLLLLISSACFAQRPTFNQGGPASNNYYEEIPYETINGKIIIVVEIAGKKHRFLFDTGAPVSISKELASELNAKVLGKILVSDAFLHTDSVTAVSINGIKIGAGLIFNDIPATATVPDFFKCYNVDGVIGSNMLRKSIITIASDTHLIIFTDQKSRLILNSKNSSKLVSNIGMQSLPFVNIQVKAKKNIDLGIQFDTGDDAFFRLDNSLIAKLQPYAVFDTVARGYGSDMLSEMGLQNVATKYLLKVSPFVVGTGKFINLITESNKDAQPSMGAKLLKYGRVTLDFINGKFYFDAYQPVNDLAEKQWPFKPSFVAGKLVVGVVWGKANSQLTQGEQVLAIDGEDCSKLTLCDLITNKSLLYGKQTAVLTLISQMGNVKKVTINKE